jgi:hypothetical protein
MLSFRFRFPYRPGGPPRARFNAGCDSSVSTTEPKGLVLRVAATNRRGEQSSGVKAYRSPLRIADDEPGVGIQL